MDNSATESPARQLERNLFAGSDPQPSTRLIVRWAGDGADLLSTYHSAVRELAREAEEESDEVMVQTSLLVLRASDRLQAIPEQRYQAAREEYQAEKERAETVFYAAGRGRNDWQETQNIVTDRMKRARDRLGETAEQLEQARAKGDELEEEFEALSVFLSRFAVNVPDRRMRQNLKDREDLLRSFGSRPSPSALRVQDHRYGWAG